MTDQTQILVILTRVYASKGANEDEYVSYWGRTVTEEYKLKSFRNGIAVILVHGYKEIQKPYDELITEAVREFDQLEDTDATWPIHFFCHSNDDFCDALMKKKKIEEHPIKTSRTYSCAVSGASFKNLKNKICEIEEGSLFNEVQIDTLINEMAHGAIRYQYLLKKISDQLLCCHLHMEMAFSDDPQIAEKSRKAIEEIFSALFNFFAKQETSPFKMEFWDATNEKYRIKEVLFETFDFASPETRYFWKSLGKDQVFSKRSCPTMKSKLEQIQKEIQQLAIMLNGLEESCVI